MTLNSHPNPALTVGAGNMPGWNQPEARRHSFHNAHLLFRRVLMVRSRRVLDLTDAPDAGVAERVRASGLTELAPFSALVVAQGNLCLFQSAAADFATDRPHSVQSISKMLIHLIIGELVATGQLSLDARIGDLLPWVGTAYDRASLQDVLDMNVANDFTEDYSDPDADCFREEAALGFRLVPGDEPTLRAFVASLTGTDLINHSGWADYKSANTDLLTLLAAQYVDLPARLTAIVDAAGFEGALHISLSPEGLPALSGGGCLSARDLARLGLLFARKGEAVYGPAVGSPAFMEAALTRSTPRLGRNRGTVRYANHVMTNGRWLGHGGYGGQFLMADLVTGRSAAFLSVLQNDSGWDDGYAAQIVAALNAIICS